MSSPAASIVRVSDSQRRLGTAAICLATIAMPLDTTVNVAFPDIVNSFRLPIADIQWVVISYTLTYAALMLVCGRAGDLYGHRGIFLIGCVVSTVAFIGCTIAPTYPLLLAARVLQGTGAALALSCGPALITALYLEDQRTRVLGLYTLVFGLGSAIGPPLGGVLVQQWGWPSVYAFRIPISGLALLLGLMLPNNTPRAGGRFDGLGAMLLVTAIAALLVALNQLQRAQNVWLLAALFVLFAALGAGFLLQQQRAEHPVVELKYFRDADFSLLNIGHVTLNLAAFAVWLFVPFYLDRISALSITTIGLLLAIPPIGYSIASPIAGWLASRINSRRVAVLGAVAATTGSALIGLGDGLGAIMLGCLAQGIGLGLYQVAYFDIATATLPVQQRGVAGSLVMMTRTLGVVIGATVLTLVFQKLTVSASIGGADTAAAFLSGFNGAFRFAAALALVIVVAALVRGWARL